MIKKHIDAKMPALVEKFKNSGSVTPYKDALDSLSKDIVNAVDKFTKQNPGSTINELILK